MPPAPQNADAPRTEGSLSDGKHLIILAHGVLGEAADWNNWIAVWHDEVARRTALLDDARSHVPPSAGPNAPRGPSPCPRRSSSHSDGQTPRAAPPEGPVDATELQPGPADLRPSSRIGPADVPGPPHPRPQDHEFLVLQLKGHTLKGCEKMAVRACAQAEAFLQRRPGEFTRYSIIGHSYGGIYGKAMLLLRRQYPALAQLAPQNFVTLAAPHMACRRRLRPALRFQQASKWFFAKSGTEAMLEDRARSLPTITAASVPELRRFQNLMAYGNVKLVWPRLPPRVRFGRYPCTHSPER